MEFFFKIFTQKPVNSANSTHCTHGFLSRPNYYYKNTSIIRYLNFKLKTRKVMVRKPSKILSMHRNPARLLPWLNQTYSFPFNTAHLKSW